MLAFKASETFYLVVAFIVPGLVIVYVRSRFISGRIPSHTDNALGYVALSLVYYALAFPIFGNLLSINEPWILRVAALCGLTLIGPAIFGLLLGASAQKDWGTWLARKIGLTTIHVIPTAWDWRFSKIPPGGMFLMVTLSSGERVAGYFGPNSFASSDISERDIYIEEEYDVDDVGKWSPRPAKVGILIPMKEIRNVEFWEPEKGVNNAER